LLHAVKIKFIITIVLASAACLAGFLLARASLRKESLAVYQDGRKIPPSGLVIDPQGVNNPGDTRNAERDFRKIYKALITFRKSKGRLPKGGEFLTLNSDGESAVGLTHDDLHNPDRRFADGKDVREGAKLSCDYALAWLAKRKDGTKKPSFPKRGERDVWMISQDYIRDGLTIYPDGTGKYHKKGVYVVLFSDGKIERIPYSATLLIPTGPQSFALAMPGEPMDEAKAIPVTQHWARAYGKNCTWE